VVINCGNTIAGENAVIGDHNQVDPGVVVGDHVRIGSCVHIASKAVIGSNVTISDCTNISNGTVVQSGATVAANNQDSCSCNNFSGAESLGPAMAYLLSASAQLWSRR
jgi:UDP-3-O-[3-hydroxymyristoyl] glucosamine N-acyltransferase